MTTKLSTKEIQIWKESQLRKQKYICPLCGGSLKGLPLNKIAADHCHETGYLREVLHMACNSAEGKILQVLKSWGKCETLRLCANYAHRLAEYWKHHAKNPIPLFHPTHRTHQELMAAKAKAQVKRKKLKEPK